MFYTGSLILFDLLTNQETDVDATPHEVCTSCVIDFGRLNKAEIKYNMVILQVEVQCFCESVVCSSSLKVQKKRFPKVSLTNVNVFCKYEHILILMAATHSTKDRTEAKVERLLNIHVKLF